MEPVPVGLLISRDRLTSAFTERLAGLAKVEVNLFLPDGRPVTGILTGDSNHSLDRKGGVKA